MFSKTAAALLATGLIASVSASNVHAAHVNLHHKKAVSAAEKPVSSACGCYTYTTTYYGEATWVPETTTSSSSSSSSTSSTSSTTSWSSSSSSSSAAPPPPPTTSSTSSWVAPTTSSSTWVAPTTSDSWAAPAVTSAPAASSSHKGGLIDFVGSVAEDVASVVTSAAGAVASKVAGVAAAIAPNGEKWAITYTPYNNDGTCKSAAAVAADIQLIKAKGFTSVRIYSTDCSAPQNVGDACKAAGLKIILGVWIDGTGLGPAGQQVATLKAWGPGNWDLVELVVVGNEALFNGYCSASELAGFITSTKSELLGAGYNGPITTTDTLGAIQAAGSTICPAVDVISANIHAYFNGAVEAAGAGAFVKSQLDLLANVCGGDKIAYNLETGWPSGGDANGAAVAGVAEQQIAIASITAQAGSKSVFFSFTNDLWKPAGKLGVEQFWGCSSLF